MIFLGRKIQDWIPFLIALPSARLSQATFSTAHIRYILEVCCSFSHLLIFLPAIPAGAFSTAARTFPRLRTLASAHIHNRSCACSSLAKYRARHPSASAHITVLLDFRRTTPFSTTLNVAASQFGTRNPLVRVPELCLSRFFRFGSILNSFYISHPDYPTPS